jgi:hypothetical protein
MTYNVKERKGIMWPNRIICKWEEYSPAVLCNQSISFWHKNKISLPTHWRHEFSLTGSCHRNATSLLKWLLYVHYFVTRNSLAWHFL